MIKVRGLTRFFKLANSCQQTQASILPEALCFKFPSAKLKMLGIFRTLKRSKVVWLSLLQRNAGSECIQINYSRIKSTHVALNMRSLCQVPAPIKVLFINEGVDVDKQDSHIWCVLVQDFCEWIEGYVLCSSYIVLHRWVRDELFFVDTMFPRACTHHCRIIGFSLPILDVALGGNRNVSKGIKKFYSFWNRIRHMNQHNELCF